VTARPCKSNKDRIFGGLLIFRISAQESWPIYNSQLPDYYPLRDSTLYLYLKKNVCISTVGLGGLSSKKGKLKC
jgi:hypothetical protein